MKAASAQRIAAAKAESLKARSQFLSTATALQQRLRPGTLANQAWTGVKEKGGEIADDAVEAVKHKPAIASGVAAAFLLFLAREPLMSAASRLLNGGSADGKSKKERGRRKRANGGEPATPAATRHKDEGVSA